MTQHRYTAADITTFRDRFTALERPSQPRSTRAVIMQELMPAIEAKLHKGWRYADIVAGLQQLGLHVSANTLRNYVARARQHAPDQESTATISAGIKPGTSTTPPQSPTKPIRKKRFAGFDEAP